jgi:hypothetical protein
VLISCGWWLNSGSYQPRRSAERDRLEQELFGSLAHLEAHVPQLRAWWEELIDTLPDDELEE